MLIDALGDKQQEMPGELAAALPDGVLDDHGITTATKAETPAAVPAKPDVLGQLEQLGKLRDAGVPTDAEFEVEKSELLDRL